MRALEKSLWDRGATTPVEAAEMLDLPFETTSASALTWALTIPNHSPTSLKQTCGCSLTYKLDAKATSDMWRLVRAEDQLTDRTVAWPD